ncbi:Gfo/Idh/MocA family protein [Chengkuizengella axinellae]|uniref:Gfo/Idh/MocA family oxidoreductase n=1 Tax=Chengkuizengella axinellae TaxID=3064388 RepID=A0ABT9IWN3_9BACL|nr:Gfo/Idh/MocA family oxidoreductase [Chengkuizengella sp. 2205SS18-9]MDP5273195.1 Gfo/Idh/MocA family oxidoreductase [Chengkuizengella sp. 2205SS18-9]
MQTQKVKWGILGCANIAINAVIPGIKQSSLNEVNAIASRGKDKAVKAAKDMNIPKAYGSYEALLSDPDIEAVYIPLPNHLHKEWTIKAAQAGKHVLCEKPLALNEQEASEMIKACEKAGVKLAEAFMYRYHPRYEQMKAMIKGGEIGEIRAIHSAFTFNNADDLNNVRYKQYMGGGSLYDVGVYPISAARFILECEPEAVTTHALFSSEHDHVDMMASGLVEFPNHVSLTFDCGMWAEFRNSLEIVGSDGKIEVPSAYITMKGMNYFTVTKNGLSRMIEVPEVNQYALQADHFAKSIQQNEPLTFPSQDAYCNMRVVTACIESAKGRKRIELI